MSGADSPAFACEDDPGLPGWTRWQFRDASRYNAFLEPPHVRVEGEIGRVRMLPQRQHVNMRDHVYGGALLGFMDVALFAATLRKSTPPRM